MQTQDRVVYDVVSALSGVVLAKGATEERAAALMTSSRLSLGDARVALAVTLPGEQVRCGAVTVQVRSIDLAEAMAQLDAAIADEQASDRALSARAA